MYPVSEDLLMAWRKGGYEIEPRVRAYRNGRPVILPDVDGLRRGTLEVVSGSVNMTDASGVRSTLDIEVAPSAGLWDALAPFGTRLHVEMVFRWGVQSETVPMGWFEVAEQSLSYTDGGTLSMSGCPDLWARVLDRRLDVAVTPSGNAVDIAVRYAQEALGADVQVRSVRASTARVWGQVYEDSRDDLVQELLAAAGRLAYVDRELGLVVRPGYSLNEVPVWNIDPFHSGVLVSADRTRSSRAVRNRIIVRPAGAAVFRQVTVDDTDPDSPTRVTGPLGPRPRFLVNPAIRTVEQAQNAARLLLHRSTGLAADLSLSAAPNWALDPGDVVHVALPGVNGDGWAAEQHVVASVTHNLGTGAQSITTRSTRPDGGEDVEAQ